MSNLELLKSTIYTIFGQTSGAFTKERVITIELCEEEKYTNLLQMEIHEGFKNTCFISETVNKIHNEEIPFYTSYTVPTLFTLNFKIVNG